MKNNWTMTSMNNDTNNDQLSCDPCPQLTFTAQRRDAPIGRGRCRTDGTGRMTESLDSGPSHWRTVDKAWNCPMELV